MAASDQSRRYWLFEHTSYNHISSQQSPSSFNIFFALLRKSIEGKSLNHQQELVRPCNLSEVRSYLNFIKLIKVKLKQC